MSRNGSFLLDGDKNDEPGRRRAPSFMRRCLGLGTMRPDASIRHHFPMRSIGLHGMFLVGSTRCRMIAHMAADAPLQFLSVLLFRDANRLPPCNNARWHAWRRVITSSAIRDATMNVWSIVARIAALGLALRRLCDGRLSAHPCRSFHGQCFCHVGRGRKPVGDGNFLFVPDPRDPLVFRRADPQSHGAVIQPGLMYTDGGSIPKIAQVFNGFSPWGYAPAYMIHDWLFVGRHCLVDGEPGSRFDQIRDVDFDDRRPSSARRSMRWSRPTRSSPTMSPARRSPPRSTASSPGILGRNRRMCGIRCERQGQGCGGSRDPRFNDSLAPQDLQHRGV